MPKKLTPEETEASLRIEIYDINGGFLVTLNVPLARSLSEHLKGDGFQDVRVDASETAVVWKTDRSFDDIKESLERWKKALGALPEEIAKQKRMKELRMKERALVFEWLDESGTNHD